MNLSILRRINFCIVLCFLCAGCASSSKSIQNHTPQKILFIGNSITVVEPVPSIGWFGNWGMAASSAENDYIHLVSSAYGAEFRAKNVANWERGFENYDYNELSPLIGWADTVIVKIGENVVNHNSNYSTSFAQLVKYITPANKQVYIVSTWWIDNFTAINNDMKTVAMENGYHWVQIPSHNASYNALSFNDPGVAGHPGDKGMKLISESILSAID